MKIAYCIDETPLFHTDQLIYRVKFLTEDNKTVYFFSLYREVTDFDPVWFDVNFHRVSDQGLINQLNDAVSDYLIVFANSSLVSFNFKIFIRKVKVFFRNLKFKFLRKKRFIK